MAQHYSPRIVTDNLVMCLDPSQNKSYPTTDLPVKNGLVMWMDAADDTTFSYSSGTTVSQWRDKSGFNYHMVPVSAGPTRNAFLIGYVGANWPNIRYGLIRMYSRVLTSAEITQNYEATRTRFEL